MTMIERFALDTNVLVYLHDSVDTPNILSIK